jgi:two-component system LytT family sensor kinase
MKLAAYLILLLFLAHTGFSQTAIIDSVNPLFKGKLNGDKIRASYDNFEPAFPAGKIVRGRYNQVTMSMFHSKSLYVGTALNQKEKLKELEPFRRQLSPGQGYASFGNDDPGLNAVALFDSMPIVVTAYGINERNKSIYRFRVLENGQRELVPWQEPRFFSPVMIYYQYDVDGTEQKQMAYLGEFSAPIGNSLTIEVKNLMIPDTVYKISAVWIKRAPSVIGIFNPDKLKQLIEVYKFQWKYDFARPNGATYYGDITLKPVDSLLTIDSVYHHDQNNLFVYLRDKTREADWVEYNLVKDNDSSGWQANEFDPNIISLQRLTPGHYTLLLRYAFQQQTINTFSFTISQAWYETYVFKVALGAIVGFFSALLYGFFKSRKQKRLLQQQKIKRQQAEMGLLSIRSQFNPHFVFNALSSIQGLIHKRDVDNADKYLSDFSRLMRESLQSGNKEMITLDRELLILKSYIDLEKLRFNFNYTISVDEKINVHTIELPTLLLQPLIENAIKHGVSGMYDKGILKIAIHARQNDMQVEISDNGKGFDVHKTSGGYGIQLTRERTQLLSDMHPAQSVTLSISADINGTTAMLLFKNWLI